MRASATKLLMLAIAGALARRARLRPPGRSTRSIARASCSSSSSASTQARQARDRVGPAAARAERLVDARVRRERRRHQAQDGDAAAARTSSWCRREGLFHESRRERRERAAACDGVRTRARRSAQFPLARELRARAAGVRRARARVARGRAAAHGPQVPRGAGRRALLARREITAHRGTITDRYGEPLAVSHAGRIDLGESEGARARQRPDCRGSRRR